MSEQHVFLGDAMALCPTFEAFDVLITDPPYSAHVHASAVSQSKTRGVRKRDFGFNSLTPEFREYIARACAGVRRWGIVYSDVESVALMRAAVEVQGGTYIRTIPWVRWSMPQLSGDRPTTGWEALLVTLGSDCETIVCTWGAQGGRKHWNGPGNLTHLAHKCLRGEDKHRAEKPLDQALDLVSWFSDPEDVVFDPCAGSGTIGLACRILGRSYIGCEIDPAWAERAQERIARVVLSARDDERMQRWQKTEAARAA